MANIVQCVDNNGQPDRRLDVALASRGKVIIRNMDNPALVTCICTQNARSVSQGTWKKKVNGEPVTIHTVTISWDDNDSRMWHVETLMDARTLFQALTNGVGV